MNLPPSTAHASRGDALQDSSRLIVVSLCAAWCETCGRFHESLQRIAQARPDVAFVWVDIEDDADVAGDVEVETFPTLAIYRGFETLHFGVSLAHEAAVARLVDALADRGSPLVDPPTEIRALRERLARR